MSLNFVEKLDHVRTTGRQPVRPRRRSSVRTEVAHGLGNRLEVEARGLVPKATSLRPKQRWDPGLSGARSGLCTTW
jgi:hypothetical protein